MKPAKFRFTLYWFLPSNNQDFHLACCQHWSLCFKHNWILEYRVQVWVCFITTRAGWNFMSDKTDWIKKNLINILCQFFYHSCHCIVKKWLKIAWNIDSKVVEKWMKKRMLDCKNHGVLCLSIGFIVFYLSVSLTFIQHRDFIFGHWKGQGHCYMIAKGQDHYYSQGQFCHNLMWPHSNDCVSQTSASSKLSNS